MDLEPAAGTFPTTFGASRNKTSCKSRVTAGFTFGMLLLQSLGVSVALGEGVQGSLCSQCWDLLFYRAGLCCSSSEEQGGLWEGFSKWWRSTEGLALKQMLSGSAWCVG